MDGRVPLKITAITIIMIKIRLWPPRIFTSVPGLLISGFKPDAISFLYAFISK